MRNLQIRGRCANRWMLPLLFFWLATVYVNVCTKNYVWILHCRSWRLCNILPGRPILMHVNFKRLTQMLKRGHYNLGILLSNYKRTKIEERSVIVMLLSQVFWSSGACFCLLNTGHLNLLASSPYGDTVKSRRARSTPEETRKLCRSLARFLAACFARPNRRDCSQATNSSH